MTENLKVCPKCGGQMKFTGETALGSDRPPYEDGSVRRLECENDSCKHKIVDLGISENIKSGEYSTLEP
jgi:hypothetical protein